MGHYFESGFTVRVPAWHGLGQVLDDYPIDWADARKKAGLEWEPMTVPAYVKMPSPVLVPVTRCGNDDCKAHAGAVLGDKHFECAACGTKTPPIMSEYMPVDNWNAVVRDDTHKGLGVVSDQHSLIYHRTMGEIMEALHEGDSKLKFETAGSLKGGAHVYALAYLDEPVRIANDDTESFPYLALTNAHDGSGACRLFFTTVRIVCWNTYSAAIADSTRREYIFRHTGDMTAKIEEAKKAILGMREDNAEWVTLANALYELPVNKEQFDDYMKMFLPEPVGEVISPRVRNNIDSARKVFADLYEGSPTTDGHRGTALGLIDTSVEYLDHLRGYRNKDTYLGRTMLRREPLKTRALHLVAEVLDAPQLINN